MKTIQLLGAALLGLTISFSAHAQTPVVGTPGAPIAPTSPILTTGSPQGATVVPGATGLPTGMPAGAVPANATTPIGTSGQLYPAGGVPTRNVDGGTLRSDQPTIGDGNPATIGGQPTRRINKGRTTTTPVRP